MRIVFCAKTRKQRDFRRYELGKAVRLVQGNGGNALTVIKKLFHDPQLVRRRPAQTATAIGDDFYLRHKHMLKAILKPPWSAPRCPAETGASSVITTLST